MGVQHDSEDLDALLGQSALGASANAVALRDDGRLLRRNDVPPVGVHSHRQHPGVVWPQLGGVVDLEAARVAHLGALRGVGVVRLHHEVA